MPAVNPDILSWARDGAGLSQEEAVAKLSLHAAYGKTPVERLEELESGVRTPTRPMLVKMAKQYRRPLVTFYLSKPPKRCDRGTDFRSLSGVRDPSEDARVRVLVRQILARQSILRDILAEEEAPEVPFVGSLTLNDGLSAALELARQVLRSSYASQAANPTHAFEKLRESVHEAGVFVLLKGDLGSYQTVIDTETFRGFALADRLAPFIVINDNDARAAWSFTLVHELVHLFLGHTGISGIRAGNRVEQFCNDVASAHLLPEKALEALELSRLEREEMEGAIGAVARAHNVSRSLVAYRLFRSNQIAPQEYRGLISAFRTQWLGRREEQREAARAIDGGPNFYTVRRHRAGKALVDAVRNAHLAGDLPTTRAALVLGVKPTQVGKMLSG